MEDTNNVEKIIKIVKIIFITIIIVGTVFVIISSIQRNKNFNNLNDYLISIGYKETREFDSFKLIKSYKPLKNGYFFVNF